MYHTCTMDTCITNINAKRKLNHPSLPFTTQWCSCLISGTLSRVTCLCLLPLSQKLPPDQKLANEPKGNIWQRDLQVLSAPPPYCKQRVDCVNIYAYIYIYNVCYTYTYATKIAPIPVNFGRRGAFYSRHGFLSGFVWQLGRATTRRWDSNFKVGPKCTISAGTAEHPTVWQPQCAV